MKEFPMQLASTNLSMESLVDDCSRMIGLEKKRI